jgi:hypothetical protein
MPDLIEIIKVAKFVILSKAISVLIKILRGFSPCPPPPPTLF